MSARLRTFTSVLALMLLLASFAHAQGVPINATGAAADTSAMLDLVSSNKDPLVPRITAAQRAAIGRLACSRTATSASGSRTRRTS